jgi:hypothetical protein
VTSTDWPTVTPKSQEQLTLPAKLVELELVWVSQPVRFLDSTEALSVNH